MASNGAYFGTGFASGLGSMLLSYMTNQLASQQETPSGLESPPTNTLSSSMIFEDPQKFEDFRQESDRQRRLKMMLLDTSAIDAYNPNSMGGFGSYGGY